MNQDIYNEARIHFFESGQRFEYGRPDMVLHSAQNGRTDPSRTEEDRDHDGRRGVDCSSFVWRGLHDAGYDVGNAPFGTHDLFEGRNPTAYARQHFDVIPAAEARQPHGNLQPGDIVMFRDRNGSGQHVGIVRDYDAQGHLRFIGSQVSTGPGEITVQPGGYWDGKNMEIVGALRAKPEFQVRQPLHAGQSPQAPAHTNTPVASPGRESTPAHAVTPQQPATSTAPGHVLREGAHGTDVHGLQERLNALGATDAKGHRLETDSHFGQHTREAVERFQRAHGLQADGEVGPKTLDAMKTQERQPRLDSVHHGNHAMYSGATDAVNRLDAQHGRATDEASQRLAGAATVAALQHGLTSIDHIVMNQDASKAYAVQGDLNSPLKKVAEIDMQQALATPLDKSSEAAMQQTTQSTQAAQQAQQHASEQHQTSSMQRQMP